MTVIVLLAAGVAMKALTQTFTEFLIPTANRRLTMKMIRLAAMAAVASTILSGTAVAVDWPGYANGYDSQRHSPLTQITPQNAATIKSGDDGPFQAGPLMVNDTLYVTTGHTTVALNASDCSASWRHVYTPEESEIYPVNRGAAYLNGRLFRGTADGRLFALDAQTGREVWRVKAGDPAEGEFFGAAPLAWNGLVFLGPAGSDWGIKGGVAAFDVDTGKEAGRVTTSTRTPWSCSTPAPANSNGTTN